MNDRIASSNLTKRIESIMSYRIGQNLNRAKKLLLASAGVVALAGPLVIGIGQAPAIHAQTQIASEPAKASPLAFEVASVKPHVLARNGFAFATAISRTEHGVMRNGKRYGAMPRSRRQGTTRTSTLRIFPA